MFEEHVLAMEMAKKGLKTTVITDLTVFAMISKNEHGCSWCSCCDGQWRCDSTCGVVALAAQKHAAPLVVVAGKHELCPLYPQNPAVLLNETRSPYELLDFEEISNAMNYGTGSGSPRLHVVNLVFDYVPPELVSLFVTDICGKTINCEFIYRLIADYYSSDDMIQQQKPTS